ncbi:hypothetical protein VNO80_21880 [Phaseolus coccineus]|uniref:Uncharacterized protein n=1 Tax=Phaseolus coccineus TaxID=3886 RepID=A0AAN9M341_PHACN
MWFIIHFSDFWKYALNFVIHMFMIFHHDISDSSNILPQLGRRMNSLHSIRFFIQCHNTVLLLLILLFKNLYFRA